MLFNQIKIVIKKMNDFMISWYIKHIKKLI